MVGSKYYPAPVQAILNLIEVDHLGRSKHKSTAMYIDHYFLLADIGKMYMMEDDRRTGCAASEFAGR